MRINENKNHINKKTCQSVIAQHRLEHSYEFDWENIKLLDIERHLSKRLIFEFYAKYSIIKQ